jgi:hypothetical protein
VFLRRVRVDLVTDQRSRLTRSLLCAVLGCSLLACVEFRPVGYVEGARRRPDGTPDVREAGRGSFVSRTQQGEILLTTRYYNPRKGKAVLSTDPKDPSGALTLVCEREAPVGSHLPEWVCRYEADEDIARRGTEEAVREIGRNASQTTRGGR